MMFQFAGLSLWGEDEIDQGNRPESVQVIRKTFRWLDF